MSNDVHVYIGGRKYTENFDLTGYLERKINVRMEGGKLIVAKLPGEEQILSSEALKELIAAQVPEIKLTDLLIEVDGWMNFYEAFRASVGQRAAHTGRDPSLLN